jgi:hypothetical protein
MLYLSLWWIYIGYDLNMTKSIIRDLANCLLTGSDISPHIPPSIVKNSGLKVPYDAPLREVASHMPFEGKASLNNAQQLAKGFDGYDKSPTACEEALQHFDSCIKPDPDNSYNAGVKTP